MMKSRFDSDEGFWFDETRIYVDLSEVVKMESDSLVNLELVYFK